MRAARHSLGEIVAAVGKPKSTVNYWLRGRPLPEGEASRRRAAHATAHPKPRKDRGERSRLHMMADGKAYTPLEAGTVAELAVATRLAIHRWKVLQPVADGDVVDIYATRHASNRVLKVQVRLAREPIRHSMPTVSLRSMRNGQPVHPKPGDFDVLVGYCLYNDTAYVWTWGEVASKRCSIAVAAPAAEAWDKLDAALAAAG